MLTRFIRHSSVWGDRESIPQVKPTTFEVHESTPYRGKKWRVSGYSGDKRKRYWHATKSAAQAHARDLNLERAAYGSDLVLTPALRLEVVQATQLLAPHGKSLLDGIRFYVDHLTVCAVLTVTFAQLAAKVRGEFAQRRAENRLTPRSVDAVCVTLKKLEARFRDVSDIRSITTLQIREWLGTLGVAIKTRNQIRGYTRQVFGLAVAWELLEKNPVTPIEKMRERYNAEKVTGSLNAADTERLLYAADPDVVSFMAIWFFAGIRKETIEKMDCSSVNLKERHAIVPRTSGKNERRYRVTLSENLISWLKPHERAEGSLMAASRAPQTRGRRNANTTRRLILEAAASAGLTPEHNVGRNTFISMHAAFHQNLQLTADEADTSPGVIQKDYRDLFSKEEAARFWNIYPPLAPIA